MQQTPVKESNGYIVESDIGEETLIHDIVNGLTIVLDEDVYITFLKSINHNIKVRVFDMNLIRFTTIEPRSKVKCFWLRKFDICLNSSFLDMSYFPKSMLQTFLMEIYELNQTGCNIELLYKIAARIFVCGWVNNYSQTYKSKLDNCVYQKSEGFLKPKNNIQRLTAFKLFKLNIKMVGGLALFDSSLFSKTHLINLSKISNFNYNYSVPSVNEFFKLSENDQFSIIYDILDFTSITSKDHSSNNVSVQEVIKLYNDILKNKLLIKKYCFDLNKSYDNYDSVKFKISNNVILYSNYVIKLKNKNIKLMRIIATKLGKPKLYDSKINILLK